MFEVTATNLPRLLTCNGSRLLADTPQVNNQNDVRDQGNACDLVISQVTSGQFTREELVNRKAPNGVYITEDMIEHLSEYLDWVVGRGETELDCSWSANDWLIKGRADHVWLDRNTKTLHVSDFKYGWKIVDVVQNYTLISHATSEVIRNHPDAVEKVSFRIYQPRPYHRDGSMREWVITKQELDTLSAYIFNTMTNLSDQVVTSKHCYKCPKWTNCPAAQDLSATALEVASKAYNADVDPDGIEQIIADSKRAMEVLKQNVDAYENLALHKLKGGTMFKNYVVAEDFGNVSWKDGVDADLLQTLTGVDVSKKTIMTPKQAVKAGVPEDIVNSMSGRKSKGLKLVKQNANQHGAKLFARKEGVK